MNYNYIILNLINITLYYFIILYYIILYHILHSFYYLFTIYLKVTMVRLNWRGLDRGNETILGERFDGDGRGGNTIQGLFSSELHFLWGYVYVGDRWNKRFFGRLYFVLCLCKSSLFNCLSSRYLGWHVTNWHCYLGSILTFFFEFQN